MILNESFNQKEFTNWINSFLPDFSQDVRNVDVSKSFQGIKSIQTIGESSLGVRVYIIETEQDPSRRKVSLAKESFTLLRDYGTPNAIIAYHCGDSTFWRLSLLTSTLSWDEGKINKKLSNPKRQSYILGTKAKVKTPHQYLVAKGSVIDLRELKSRFSLEVVNKEFYKEISHSFINLVGGTLTKGKSKEVVKSQLKLPSVGDHSQTAQEFVVRLIGRVIFSWFLREKKSSAGHSLMPHDLLSLDAARSAGDYYHTILEPIFFEVLNKKINSRKETYTVKPFSDIPYLNGGLFAPHDDDHYSYNDGKQAINHNLVVIPDSWFISFFEILETYNFTIDENTSFDEELSIDPEMLGRIFENLLAEINPETGESARKSTGSYYTPRVIVDYMVDESLYLYLKDKTSISESKLRSVISYDLDDDSTNPLTEEEKGKITQALQTVKILDPACGSGAFPIGALQKIVFILQQIDPHGQIWFKNQIQNTSIELKRLIQKEFEEKNFDYLRKLGVIRENIYGVDIQPIATEISRLRCFLTLVVDQRVDDTLPNRGIEPLPNLDFKFVTANTLIGLPKIESGQGSLFEDRNNIDKLSEVRSLYFSASSEERAELKNKFVEIQNDMLNALVREHRPAELTEKLATWKPFSHQQATWFDPDWMFGIKGGFDIVIANPPYLGEKGHKLMFDSLRNTTLGKKFNKGKMDLFYYFFHLGIDTLKQNGILSFITTNYYPTADGAVKLRKDFFLRTNLVELINFNEYKIFESALGQHNMITLLQKNPPKEQFLTYQTLVTKNGGPDETEISNILNQSSEKCIYSNIPRNKLFDGENLYIRFTTGKLEIESVLDKLSNTGFLLKDYATTNEGLHTGLDSITEKDIKKIDEADIAAGEGVFVLPKGLYSFKHLRPWFKGSDIGHYKANTNNTHEVLYFENNIVPENDELTHLLKYRKILENRVAIKRARRPWYQLNWPRQQSMFEGQKIVNPYRSHKNYFALVNSPWYASADVFFTQTKNSSVISNEILTAILNSKVVLFWLNHRGKRKGNILEIKSIPIGQIPIFIPNSDQAEILTKLVNNIIAFKTNNFETNSSELESKVNKIIFELYQLEPEEISIIENYVND